MLHLTENEQAHSSADNMYSVGKIDGYHLSKCPLAPTFVIQYFTKA